jgi:putative membrane protein insertion efficiency factor
MVRYLLILYQKVTKYRPSSCRYYPSCSQYALDAVNKYGNVKGIFLVVMRIIRCNQFFKGGYDTVK